MMLHIFGAFFGLVLTWILFRKGSEQQFEKEKFDSKTGLFSMLGEYDVIVVLGFAGQCSEWDGYTSTGETSFKQENRNPVLCHLHSPGSVFLWMFWPSFNSVLVASNTPGRKLEVMCSTYLALAVSAVTAASVSTLSSPKRKLNLV